MGAKELAAILNSTEYPVRLSKDVEAAAKAAGLTIVFGASDDLMEFRGCIHDEVGAYGSVTVRVDANGLVPNFNDIDKDRHDAEAQLRDYFKRETGGKSIKAVWGGDEGSYSWTYKTDIPHETFEVVEDGEPYCRGIVFAMADL